MEQKIADNIRYYRKQLHLTQEKLAETMDVTIGAVSKWENGSTIDYSSYWWDMNYLQLM